KQQGAKSVGLVAPLTSCDVAEPEFHVSPSKCSSTQKNYTPFLMNGSVSIPGQGGNAPVCILRDTGAAQSFLLEGVLPLSEQTSTGTSVLIRGFEMGFVDVPLHRIDLISDLVTGSVVVGVRPSLPVPGVTFILGNDLAGGNVWRQSDTPPEVVSVPLVCEGPDELEQKYPDVFPTCAVTRAMAKQRDASDLQEECFDDLCVTFFGHPEMSDSQSVFLPTVKTSEDLVPEKGDTVKTTICDMPLSRAQLISAQKADPTLVSLFESVSPDQEIDAVPQGYFLRDGVLMRTWRPHDVPDEWKEMGVTWKGSDLRGPLADAHSLSPFRGQPAVWLHCAFWFFCSVL
ncbi:hypothetical protein ANANG_G00307450, partial [Anguilla anguilla]